VTIVFWGFLFNSSSYNSLGLAETVHVHAVDVLVMIFDIFATRIPVVIAHVYIPVAYGLIYLAVNIGYVLSGGVDENGLNNIYSILDWSNVVPNSGGYKMAIIYCVAIFVLLFITTFVAYGLSVIRDRCIPRKPNKTHVEMKKTKETAAEAGAISGSSSKDSKPEQGSSPPAVTTPIPGPPAQLDQEEKVEEEKSEETGEDKDENGGPSSSSSGKQRPPVRDVPPMIRQKSSNAVIDALLIRRDEREKMAAETAVAASTGDDLDMK